MIKKLDEYEHPLHMWKDRPKIEDVLFPLWCKINEIIDELNKKIETGSIKHKIEINAVDPDKVAECLDKQLKESKVLEDVIKKPRGRPKK